MGIVKEIPLGNGRVSLMVNTSVRGVVKVGSKRVVVVGRSTNFREIKGGPVPWRRVGW